MQANPRRGESDEDVEVQRAILALVLAVHPHHRTMSEVGREIGNKEAVERAVRRLSDYNLVRLHGTTLLVTDTAFHCHRLDHW
jgi:hypothetical protein